MKTFTLEKSYSVFMGLGQCYREVWLLRYNSKQGWIRVYFLSAHASFICTRCEGSVSVWISSSYPSVAMTSSGQNVSVSFSPSPTLPSHNNAMIETCDYRVTPDYTHSGTLQAHRTSTPYFKISSHATLPKNGTDSPNYENMSSLNGARVSKKFCFVISGVNILSKLPI